MAEIYDIVVRTLDGEETTLEDYRGQVLLIVNTASKCGFTPQYEGLEKLQKDLVSEAFTVLAFPCNQFGAQEPGNEAEIKSFCTTRYDVSFPLFAKIDVNGAHAHPLYQHLKNEAPGLLGTKAIKWNFTKFLVGKDGKVLKRFASKDTPESLRGAIDQALRSSRP